MTAAARPTLTATRKAHLAMPENSPRDTTTWATFRRNMRAARLTLGLTQSDLAALLTERGMPATKFAVSRIEGGTRQVDLTELDTIADALGSTSPAEIIVDRVGMPDVAAYRTGYADGLRAGYDGALTRVELSVKTLRDMASAS